MLNKVFSSFSFLQKFYQKWYNLSKGKNLKSYIGLVTGFIIGLYGLYRIDSILVKGLNYFGKYVFFGLFNVFCIYLFWFFYKRFDGYLKILMPLFFGFILLLLGVKLA